MTARVLVVDDDPLWAEMLCAIISMCGYATGIAGTMKSAIIALRISPADVTLLDLSLPDSDTVSTLDSIRFLKSIGAGRVLIITGQFISEEFRQMASGYGADGVIEKDVHGFQERLVDAIS